MAVAPESEEQKCLFRWAGLAAAKWPELWLLHAIPNGGLRNIRTAALMKATGAKPGVPDIFLPVARQGKHGLYIEMKRRVGGRLSKCQAQWLATLACQGYAAHVCNGFEEARAVITEYLGGRE